jgi:hypothetical protein
VNAPWQDIIHSLEVFSNMANEHGLVSCSKSVVSFDATKPLATNAAPNLLTFSPTDL